MNQLFELFLQWPPLPVDYRREVYVRVWRRIAPGVGTIEEDIPYSFAIYAPIAGRHSLTDRFQRRRRCHGITGQAVIGIDSIISQTAVNRNRRRSIFALRRRFCSCSVLVSSLIPARGMSPANDESRRPLFKKVQFWRRPPFFDWLRALI